MVMVCGVPPQNSFPQRSTDQVQPGSWGCSALPPQGSAMSCLELSLLAKVKVQTAACSPGVLLPSVWGHCLSPGCPQCDCPLTSATSMFAVCSPPRFCQHRTKGAFNSSLFVKPGCFDRCVAEDVRNKQTGAITPSQLLPTLG